MNKAWFPQLSAVGLMERQSELHEVPSKLIKVNSNSSVTGLAQLKWPTTPEHCHQVFVWQNQVLPALDLASWLLKKPIRRDQAVVAVTAYQSEPNALPQYGGLLLSTLPTQLQVDDAQVSALPDQPEGWLQLAVSCFRHEDLTVPIIDLPTIYSNALLAT